MIDLTQTLTLSGLAQTYDGLEKPVTVTTSPVGLSGVAVTYDLASVVPINAGSYTVEATLTNANYAATPASGSLVIAKATATVTLGDLAQTYDGTTEFIPLPCYFRQTE